MSRNAGFATVTFLLIFTACENESDMVNDGAPDVSDGGVALDTAREGYLCPEGFVQIGGACCPQALPQRCGDTCVPSSCQCVSEYGICVPPDSEYCGAGIACPSGEHCVADDATFVCVPSGRTYCGNGVNCDLIAEQCASDDSGTYCIPRDWEFCGAGRSCSPREHCAGTTVGCCPDEQVACGESRCCFEDEECAESGIACVPRGGYWCSGETCPAGYSCATDGLPLCVPATADYCGGGRICPPGSVCASDGGCCPLGLPQRCGSVCCPSAFECRSSPWGEVCLPPGVTACGPSSRCDPDEFCAREGLCLPVGAELCSDGHWCPPGLNCSGSTCCREYAPTTCGSLCCPSGWLCISGGTACIPPGADFCTETGTWCGPSSRCSSSSPFGRCITIGWQECGSGPPCAPDQVCAHEDQNQRCCPSGQPILCGSICCDVEFQCVHAGGRDLCIPAGATYCDGRSEQEWCPVATRCGRRLCIPVWLDECADGSYCPGGYECTESNPPCCPVGATVTCGGRCCVNGSTCCGALCCPAGSTCTTLRGTSYCLPPGAEICHSIMGEDICFAGTFCERDGACLNNRLRSESYNYCGSGRTCPNNRACQGLCSTNCCEVNHDGTSRTAGCLRGCIPAGRLCYDQPTTNAPNAYRTARESSISSNEVPHEVGGSAELIDILTDFLGILPFFDVDFNFHPAGFDECYDNSVYRVDTCNPPGRTPPEITNWVNRRNPGITLRRGNEILVAEAFWAIDALEGIDFPHGPYAQLRALTFSRNRFSNINRVTPAEAHSGYIDYRFLKGPLSGNCTWEVCTCVIPILWWCAYERCSCGGALGFDTNAEQEWVSNVFMRYTSGWAGLHKWGVGETDIRFAIMESDGGFPEEREDDYMGFVLVNRAATKTPCGVWVPLYKYEPEGGEGYPPYYYPTGNLAGLILLRTITCTGRAGDSC